MHAARPKPLISPENKVKRLAFVEEYKYCTVEAWKKVLWSKKNSVFQEDNAPVHTAKVARDFLHSKKVELLPWPLQSPDLNPIEELWSIVESGLRKRESGPCNIRELEKMVIEEWESIPKDLYRKLISSMPSRIQVVISAKGGHTKY